MSPRAVRIETSCSFRKYNKELQKIVLFSENLIFLMNRDGAWGVCERDNVVDECVMCGLRTTVALCVFY